MNYFARCDANGLILEIFEHETLTPSDVHIPAIASQFIRTATHVEPGGTYIKKQYSPPVQKVDPVRYAVVSPPIFMMLWTVSEQVKLEAMQQYDQTLSVFFRRLQDPRVTEVDMNLPSVQQGIDYSLGRLNLTDSDKNARRAEILAGVLK